MTFIKHSIDKESKAKWLGGIIVFGMLSIAVVAADDEARKYVRGTDGKVPKPIVAVKDVCAWPNLTLLRDGTVVATIHNQPSHLKVPADIDCWASEDGGLSWAKRGTPVPRDNPKVARGNVAAGLARSGDLIVISSGWSDPVAEKRGSVLPPILSRSSDGGRTWTISKLELPQIAIPFGDILEGGDGRLVAAFYRGKAGSTKIYSSSDDGKTWGEPVVMNADAVIHEPAIFHLGKGKWLGAARFDGLDLYTSGDDARTWTRQKRLTAEKRHPGHFARLNDGTMVLSYGNREEPKGVDVLFSNDEGKSWSKPFRVVDFQSDGGYPASVQLPDGKVLTAYYAKKIAGYDGYHMGVVVWDPAATRKP